MTPQASDLVERLWRLHVRGLSYASATPAVNMLLADLSGGLSKAIDRIQELEADNARLREGGSALARLLRMTVPVPAGCVAPEGTPMSPEFRVSVQLIAEDGVHFIIHADGFSSDTLDLVATRHGLALLAPFEAGETQSERIARTAAALNNGGHDAGSR